MIELECGITVYPAREEQGRWRAVWHENGERQQCEAASEEKLAAKLEKVTERLEADAPHMKLRGADLIAYYLSPDRLPVQGQWSRKHAHTQRRLCERFAAPVIEAVVCQDIKTEHMQKIVNTAPTPGEGDRVRGMISALVGAGLEGGYLVNPRLAKVHWQAGDRPMPAPRVTVAGESALWVDPAEVPGAADVAGLGHALAAGRHGDRDELMANTAAYSGLRWGELTALTIPQIDQAGRDVVTSGPLPVAGHLQHDRGVRGGLQQSWDDPGLVAADQPRLFERRADGLLGAAQPGAVQPLIGHPHAGDGALLGQQLLGAFWRYRAYAALGADVVGGRRPGPVLDLACAGINRHGGGDGRAPRRRASDPRRPRVMRDVL